MKVLFPLVLCCLLSSCLYSYSKIDASEWSPFDVQATGYLVKLELPGGFSEHRNMFSSASTIGLLKVQYDHLSGPNIYGTPRGETRIFLYQLSTDFSGIDEYIVRHGEIGCDMFEEKKRFTECAEEEHKHTRYLGHTEGSWHRFEYISETKAIVSRDYVFDIGSGDFLNFKGVVSGRAFEREKVRAERLAMIEDIFLTVRLVKSQSEVAIDTE